MCVLTPVTGVAIPDLCFFSVRETTIGATSLCFGPFGYANRLVRDVASPHKDEWTGTVRALGYNVTHALFETYGVEIDHKWARHTRGLAMAPVAAAVITFALACHFGHLPLGPYAFATAVVLITIVVEWAIVGGILVDLKAHSTGLDVSTLGDILYLELCAFLVLFLGTPVVWLSKELHAELLVRAHTNEAGSFAATAATEDDVAPNGSIVIPAPRSPTPPPSVPSTPSRLSTPSLPRTPEAQIRKARHTWDTASDADLESAASRRAERESIDGVERELVRQHERALRMAGHAQQQVELEETEVPTGARPLVPGVSPPKSKVEKWRKTTTDAVDPTTLPRWEQ